MCRAGPTTAHGSGCLPGDGASKAESSPGQEARGLPNEENRPSNRSAALRSSPMIVGFLCVV
jgi:hypothetical protein